MKVVYLIAMFILFFTLLLLKKNNKKQNILSYIVFSFCIIFFYDAFIAYILTYLNIKNTLLAFSTVYLVTSGILIYLNYRKNKKVILQKYYLDKKQLICFLILILTCFTIGFFKYDKFTEIDYVITDAALHYRMADYYSVIQKIFNKAINDGVAIHYKAMFGYYVPCGIFMKAMPWSKYISYNLFNTSMLCLLTLSFYITCLEIKTSKKNNIITVFIVLMYMLAYPLNYMIYGFGYLGCGMLAVNLIIYTWKRIIQEERKSLYLILTLFNVGLFFSYYLFAPAVYLAEGLFIIYRYMKGKYSLLKLFEIGIITLIIPSIIGFMYFMSKDSLSEVVSTSTTIYAIEGTSYKNLWGNFVLLIPMIIYSVILEIKNKKIDFDIFMLISEVAYIIVTLYFTINDQISTYYFYKSYFILWMICYLYIFKLINYKNYKTNLVINYLLIIFLIVLAIFNLERKMFQKNYKFNSNPIAPELASVYLANYNTFNETDIMNKNTANLIINASKYVDKCEIKSKQKTIPYTGNFYQKLWYYGLTGYVPTITFDKENANEVYRKPFDYDEFTKKEKIKCALLTNDYIRKEKIDIKDYKVLYKDKIGILIKK